MKKILAIIALSICGLANATPSEELTNTLKSIRTMQSAFTQTIFDNHESAVQQSFGQMALERPGKFRWQIAKPFPQLIIANGSKLWIYDKDLAQVVVRKLNQNASNTPALLLSNVDGVLDKTYVISTLPNKEGLKWFLLTPRDKNNMFTAIRIGFAGNQIQKMRMQDHLGHSTLIEFKQAKVNSSLSANLFTFNAPASVDIIDETKGK